MIGCERCGRLDSTIRGAGFLYAISLLVVTFRRGSGGVLCQGCRRVEATKWTIVSALFGWWGIPWGPIYTLQAIGTNLGGGRQEDSVNAAILRAVGATLAEQGETDEAIRALEASLRFENDADTKTFLLSVQAHDELPVEWAHSVEEAFESDLVPGDVVSAIGDNAPVLGGPEVGAEVVGTLAKEPAFVLRAQGAWYQIRLASGVTGWVEARSIERT